MKKYYIKALIKNTSSSRDSMIFYIVRDGIVHIPSLNENVKKLAFYKRQDAERYIKEHPDISKEKKYYCEYEIMEFEEEK